MMNRLTLRAPVSLLTAGLLVLLLVACGGDDDESSSSSSSESTPAAAGTVRATVSAALSTTPTPNPLTTQARQQYCQARDGFKASLNQLTTLSTNSSINDIKSVTGDIKAKWADMKASARNVGQLELDQLDTSINKVTTAVDNLGQNSNMLAALASLALPVAEVVQEVRKVDIDKPCTT